jgi:hypothetical protein
MIGNGYHYCGLWFMGGNSSHFFINGQTFIEKKSRTNEPVEKTNKCTLYSSKKSKKNGKADNNWPEPEPRSLEVPIIVPNWHFIFTIA